MNIPFNKPHLIGKEEYYMYQGDLSDKLPSEINAAFLWTQLENLADIQNKRKLIWNCLKWI